MRPQFYFYCYPWDLEDEGLELALGRLAGEIGVDGICVSAIESEIRMIRGRPNGERRTFVSPAAAHFQPDASIHRSSRIRPIPAAWMKSKNPLEKISRVAGKEGLTLRARVVCCQGAHLVERYSHAACINVFGDPSETRLCPSHPDVREYVSLVIEDLSKNYPLTTIELAEFDFGFGDREAWYVHASAPGARLRQMMSCWCFCSACRQHAGSAGVDVDAARVSILEAWDASVRMERPSHQSTGDLHARFPDLAKYEQWRSEAVTQFVRGARSKAGAALKLCAARASSAGGTDFSALAAFCDGIVIPLTELEGKEPAKEEIALSGGASRCDAAITCFPPDAKDGPSLVADVQRASQAGHAAIGFANYGLAPEPCLDWVRQAIRYARREATA